MNVCQWHFQGAAFSMPHLLHSLGFKSLAGSVISAIILTSSVSYAQRGGGITVETAFVEEAVIADTTTIPGAVVAPTPVVVSALRNGEIVIAPLKVGDFIRQGTQIAKQNTDDLEYDIALLEIQLKDAEARLDDVIRNIDFETELVAVAENQMALLAQKADRARQLAVKKAISAEAAETAQSALLNAKQQVISRTQSLERLKSSQNELARASDRLSLQIKKLQSDIARAVYNAPQNGLILSLPNYQTGFARLGENLAQIQSFNGFEIEAEIPSSYLRFVRNADEISANNGSDVTLQLAFRAALPQENQRTSTRPVRFAIKGDLPRSLYAKGARVDLQVPVTEAAALLLVPQDAIVPVAGGHVVFVYDEGKAARQVVRLGGAHNDKVAVLSGLQKGEKVIVRGNEGLSDGAAVKEGKPPKRNVPSADGEAQQEVAEEKPLETELADDAVTWELAWTTNRGETTAELALSSKANLYNGEPIAVKRDGDKLQFEAEVVLPFGILTLGFDGAIAGETMSGTVTLSGLPNGRTPSFDFAGKVK